MSAGTGIRHSEYNKNTDKAVKFLQIWVFPDRRGVKPRYDQISLNPADRQNKLQQILSPNADDAGVWIHQNAWFHLGKLEKNFTAEYALKATGNGVYAFVLSGNVNISGHQLSSRDGLGLWETDKITVQADSEAEVLLMELPME